MAKISYVIPCYFNQNNLVPLYAELRRTRELFPVHTDFEYVFVDDGSGDQTWDVLVQLQNQEPDQVTLVKLVKNYGSYTAVFAGMKKATGDCLVVISADLQDPPDLVPMMFGHWIKGLKLVVAHRENREESWSQKLISNLFHKLFKKYALTTVPDGGFDLILFDRSLSETVLEFTESGLQTLYAIFSLGYPFVAIPYTRKKREVGVSRWTFSKKLKLFIDSFVGYSYVPIRVIGLAGFLFAFLSFIYIVIVIANFFINGSKIEGWSSLMVVLLVASAFQFIALGILGEYLWRVLDTVRNRPRYLVEEHRQASPREQK